MSEGTRTDTDAPNAPDAPDTADEDNDDDHLADVPDGAGCTEIWEYLAERREDEADE